MYFSVAAPAHCNSLRDDVKTAIYTVVTFRRYLKSCLFKLAFPPSVFMLSTTWISKQL